MPRKPTPFFDEPLGPPKRKKSIATREEVEAIFEPAFQAAVGHTHRINCGSHGVAMTMRRRLNMWRVDDREANREIYPFGHPLHNASVYNVLSMRVPPADAPDAHFLYITKRGPFEIEEYGPDGQLIPKAAQPPCPSAPLVTDGTPAQSTAEEPSSVVELRSIGALDQKGLINPTDPDDLFD